MCDKVSIDRKRSRKSIDEEKYYVSASFITKKSFLPFIKGSARKEYIPASISCESFYPKPNLYYAFNEDTNPFTRLDHVQNKRQCESHFERPEEPYKIRDPYCEVEARRKYLTIPPTCFVIFGKPGLSSTELATTIAEAWNCVLISPVALIQQEMERGTEKDGVIRDILRAGEHLGPEIIMNLVKARVNMRDVMHRGYIVEGIPLFPNEILDYSSYGNKTEDPSHISSENLIKLSGLSPCENRNCDSRDDETEQSNVWKSKSTCMEACKPDLSPRDNPPCKVRANLERDIAKEIDDVFTTWPIKPSVIIYASCPDEDLARKREFRRLNPLTGRILDLNLMENDESLDVSFPHDRGMDTSIESKYLLKLTDDTDRNVRFQCDLYRRLAIPTIEKWVLLHNPQNVIRVDGRAKVSRMFQIISARLRILPLPRVFLPQRLADRKEVEFEGESPEEDALKNEFKYKTNEEAMLEFARRETIVPRFPWRLSPWKFLCPVELAKGRTVEGAPEYAVRFMNNIFFLSSPTNLDLFVDNPRTFLSTSNPRTTCKIAVFGPDCSGKSRLCEELAPIFGGTVINVKKLERAFIDDRVESRMIDATRENVAKIVEAVRERLESERTRRESSRLAEFRSWRDEIVAVIDRFVDLRERTAANEEDEEISEELRDLRRVLSRNNLARVEDDPSFRERLRKDETALLSYAPKYLRLEEPPVREITEDDPEVLATMRRRFGDIYEESKHLSVDQKADIIVKNVRSVPERPIDLGFSGDGGYIVDGMYTDDEVWKKVQESGILFEDAIVLLEEEPYEHLLQKWREKCRSKPDKTEHHEAASLFYEDNMSMEEEDRGDMEELYLQHLREFTSQWEILKDLVASASITLVDCNVRDNNLERVLNSINYRYSERAIMMSDEDKLRESETAEIAEDIDVEEEEEEEEIERETEKYRDKLLTSEDNRRLGDTNHYCPVSLSKYNILRKGKEDFSVAFMNKIYLLSSAKAAEEFLEEPQRFRVPLAKPLAAIPPLRVSIVGPPGCGKTSLSDSLSREYGLTHVNHFEGLIAFMKRRAMRAFDARDILVSTENLLEEREFPEDLHDERYNSDEDIVRGFILRYWKTGGALPRKMLRECFLSFFAPPYDTRSVIFDGFPSCQEDVEGMLENCALPEVVIQLDCALEETLERMLPLLMDFWRRKQEEEMRVQQDRHEREMEEYLEQRDKWIRETLMERHVQNRGIRNMEANKDENMEGEFGEFDEIDDTYDTHDIDLGSSEERLELENIWRQEHPEPELSSDWEDMETARERITQELTKKYENDMDKLSTTRKIMEDESIDWIDVDANKSKRTVLLQIMVILDPYVFRDMSIFERTYRVDLETAERLLDCGYYFLSSFGRWCPVQLHENKVPLQMFLPMEARGEIYPVLHRRFIYFLAGNEAVLNFRKDPLKYLEQDSCAPLVSLRISIIGPPKCGKTTLARRFAETYGLRLISPGKALRHLSRYFGWTHQACLLESQLRAGHVAPLETIVRAIEMYSIDPRSISQGVVFDGFPTNRAETEELARLGLQPMIVIDLKANLDFCLECLSNDADKMEKPANFSAEFLSHRYAEWRNDRANFRDWLEKLYRNVVELDGTRSKWCVWTRADEAMRTRCSSIRNYFRESDFDKVHELEFMCVTPYEFKRRQSSYESYCPVCLSHGCTKNSALLPHHRGMVQFREYFYWICPQHLNDFMKNPLNHLPPTNTALLPRELPHVLNETVDVEHPCWAKRLRLNGFCPVTYLDCLPDRRLIPGKPDLGILYKDNVYLFCETKCRDKFLLHHTKYSEVNIKFHGTLPAIQIRDLPNFGFLEQTVAELVIQAVNQVGVIRPKIPGLTAAITAAIFIGVYLKTHNVSCELKEVDIYERVSRRILRRDKIMKMIIRKMKKRLNPYVAVPRYSSSKLLEHTSTVSHVSTRSINMIKFRRTSPTQTMVDPHDAESRRVPVPDARFDYLCQYYKPVRKVPAFLNIVDIAGLVKGAAEGLGLGNSFLSHINACDGIFHLCRAFEDDDVTHVEGDVNPVRDLEIISEELRLKDIEFLNGHLEKLEKLVVRGNDKKLKPEYDTLLKVKSVMVDDKKHIRFADWSANDIEVLNKYLFLTSKPVIYLVNLSEKDYIRKKNKWLVKIKEWVDKNDPGAVLIPFSGVFEMKLFTMEDAERTKYLEENKVTSALDKIIVQGYKALQLQYFFTVGHDEVKAWTIQKGTKAPQAGGKIHTDFERGFIMAEVMKFEDLKKEGSEAAVKAAGKYRSQGRNYVVEDGDIVLFKFNAGAGLKDAKKK